MGEYLKDNEVLTGKVGDIVIPIGENLQEGTSVDISIETSMEIENGEGIIGYEYLHGTNETVGGFQISGTISKTTEGDMIFALQYSWNDIMDPNFQYSTDQKKASIAKKIPFANPTDYEMHITWNDISIIRKKEGWFKKNSGWLSNWSKDWLPSDYMQIPWLYNWSNQLKDIEISKMESEEKCER